jgi:Zn-finger nucleic acid-binding protein
MQKMDQPEEKAGEQLLGVARDPDISVDLERRRNCPRCDGIVMLRHAHKNTEEAIIDECPGCGGFWLDAGELALIRESFEMVRKRRDHTNELLDQLKKQSMAGLNSDKHRHRTRTIESIQGFFAVWRE